MSLTSGTFLVSGYCHKHTFIKDVSQRTPPHESLRALPVRFVCQKSLGDFGSMKLQLAYLKASFGSDIDTFFANSFTVLQKSCTFATANL